jgi:putative transposase
MKPSKFTDSQILAILKKADGGQPVPALFREHGMSSATFTNGGLITVLWTRP